MQSRGRHRTYREALQKLPPQLIPIGTQTTLQEKALSQLRLSWFSSSGNAVENPARDFISFALRIKSQIFKNPGISFHVLSIY